MIWRDLKFTRFNLHFSETEHPQKSRYSFVTENYAVALAQLSEQFDLSFYIGLVVNKSK